MWKQNLTRIVKGIQENKYPYVDTSLKTLETSYNYYYDQMICQEEKMTFDEADRIWEQLKVFQNFIFGLYLDYKQRIEEENQKREKKMQEDIANGLIKVIHF